MAHDMTGWISLDPARLAADRMPTDARAVRKRWQDAYRLARLELSAMADAWLQNPVMGKYESVRWIESDSLPEHGA